MGDILKIVKSPYLNEKLSDFDEIWDTTADLELDIQSRNQIWKFLIQDADCHNIEHRFFLQIILQPIARFPDFSEILRGEPVFAELRN